jgi:glucuronokinase
MGNPSDGYNGKTISIIVRNFWAEVVLYEWEDVEIIPSQEDRSRFRSVKELVDDVRLHGYYGGIRLIKATIKKFVDYCEQKGQELHDRNFSIRYQTNIPRQVGLAGSSAIIVATLRCLMEFYGIEIPQVVLPSVALAVETKELGIGAGLQDRVIQVYEGVVYMNFARDCMRKIDGYDCAHYERLDVKLLPPLYLAYSPNVAEPSGEVHKRLRERYRQGDPVVLEAMRTFADLTERAREALLSGDHRKLGELIDENLDTRKRIYDRMPSGQIEMVERARAVGASAKFAGSGGAIIGTYEGEEMFRKLEETLREMHCEVIKPTVTT